MSTAFFEPLGGNRFRSTKHTAGPWNADSQHLGPPSALLARAFERLPTGDDGSRVPSARRAEGTGMTGPSAIARVTVEILGPVPLAELEVRAATERPGRSVELLSGEIHANGRAVVRARAWRMIHTDTTSVAGGAGAALAPPEQGRPRGRPDGWGPGYLDVMEWRMLRGSFEEPGPATVWARQKIDLVAGESPTGLQRLLTVADTGNGASNRLPPTHWWFINTELTVHVHREPEGEWICLDAATTIGQHGVGTTLSTLYDLRGPVGAGAQALMVRPR